MPLINRDLPPPPTWPPPRERAGVLETLQYVRRRDPVGHEVHTALAAAFLFALPLSTFGSGLTFALLVGYTLIRGPNTWRCYPPLLRMPVLWAFAGWVGFSGLSIAWSSAPAQGWDELQAARVVLIPLMLWPVLDRVPWLIAAALAGVVGQNGVQLLQALRLLGFEPSVEGRLDGSLHAIHVGAWCAAAMCWHLAALVHGRRGLRWGSLLALAAAAAGLVACGSRGPWISAAVTLPLMLAVTAWRRPSSRRAILVIVGCGLAGGAAAWPTASRMIEPRVQRAVQEVTDAREHGMYETSAGLRVGLWRWAWQIFTDAPVLGRGAGSYQTELWRLEEYRAVVEQVGADETRREFLTRDQAHSSYLHTLAATGVAGGLLLATLLVLALHRTVLDPFDHVYADASPYVLLGWMVGTQFDSYHLNGHLFGLFAIVIAVTLTPRPPISGFARLTPRRPAPGTR